MKKKHFINYIAHKITSAVVAAAFLLNSVSYGLPATSKLAPEKSTLSPESRFDKNDDDQAGSGLMGNAADMIVHAGLAKVVEKNGIDKPAYLIRPLLKAILGHTVPSHFLIDDLYKEDGMLCIPYLNMAEGKPEPRIFKYYYPDRSTQEKYDAVSSPVLTGPLRVFMTDIAGRIIVPETRRQKAVVSAEQAVPDVKKQAETASERSSEAVTASSAATGTYAAAETFFNIFGLKHIPVLVTGFFADVYEFFLTFTPWTFLTKRHQNASWKHLAWRSAGLVSIYASMIFVPMIVSVSIDSLASALGSFPFANIAAHAGYNVLAYIFGLPLLVAGTPAAVEDIPKERFISPSMQGRTDYLTQLMIKRLKTLPIPEAEAHAYAVRLLDIHDQTGIAVNTYYEEGEERRRYTLTPREWRRATDDFVRLANKPKPARISDKAHLEWAFRAAIQNIYYDLFPEEFLRSAHIVETDDLVKNISLTSAEKKYLDSSVGTRTYAKLRRGIDLGKPLLFVKDVNSYDMTERAIEVYVKRTQGVLVKVPVTPFTDRSQIVGSQVPADILSEKETEEILAEAEKDPDHIKIKVALGIIRGRISKEEHDITKKELNKRTASDFKEWEELKKTHQGLRSAVAGAIAYKWAWNEKVTYEEGILARMARLAHQDSNQHFYLYFDNIDAASPKVRAQLNQILLFDEMEVPEKLGETKKLTLPKNLHLIFSMSSRSVLEDAAFYDRFLRKHVDPILKHKEIEKIVPKKAKRLNELSVDRAALRSVLEERFEERLSKNPTAFFRNVQHFLAHLYDESTGGFMASSRGGVPDWSKADITRLIHLVIKNIPEAKMTGVLTDDDLVKSIPTISGTAVHEYEIEQTAALLSERFGFPEEYVMILTKSVDAFLLTPSSSDLAEDFTVGDLVNIARYIKGSAEMFQDMSMSQLNLEQWKDMIAREIWLYMTGKIGKHYQDPAQAMDVKKILWKVIKEICPKPVSFDLRQHRYIIDPKRHCMIIDGVSVNIDPSIVDETTLFDKTGLVLTSDTVKALSAMIRAELFGDGVVCLEGPTGTGKTFISEGYSKLTSVDEQGKYSKRDFYCEPIHGSTRIDRWLGYYAVDKWGNYPFFGDTEFKKALQSGGVIAASEMNTKVDRDGRASLGYWLIPKARGDRSVYLTEFPRRVAVQNGVPELNFNKRSLVVIDVNPQASYAARGELPDFLKAYVPSVYVEGDFSRSNPAALKDLLKLSIHFMRRVPSKYLNDSDRQKVIEFIARFHQHVFEMLKMKKLGQDSNYVLTIRELSRACEDFARGLREGKHIIDEKTKERDIGQILYEALELHYAKCWKYIGERESVGVFLRANIDKNFNTVTHLKMIPEDEQKGLTTAESETLAYLKDSLLEASRPTMLISPVNSRPDELVKRITGDKRVSAAHEMTMSYFTEIAHLVGTFVPVNRDMNGAEARKIIRRMFMADPVRVNSIWNIRMENEEELGLDTLDTIDDDRLIVLAIALDSIEHGEAWNARLEWKEGMITRAVREAEKTKEKVVLVFRNYHRMKPKVAVALNELLQGRQLHLEDGTILKIPANLHILALAGESFNLPMSPAEQSRWVKITTPALSGKEKQDILIQKVYDCMKERIGQDGESGKITDARLQELIASIVAGVFKERELIDRICPRDDYYFSFWDDVAFAEAIATSLAGKADISFADISQAVARERNGIYGVGLRPDEKRLYGRSTAFEQLDASFGIVSDSLVISGVSHRIIDPQLEIDTRKDRLVPIPKLMDAERSMLQAFNQHRFVVLEGPPGGGKTDMATDLFNRMGLVSFLFSSHDRVNISDFIGEFMQDESGNYILTAVPDENGHYRVPFLEMFTHGGGFIVDEGAIGRRAQELIAWLGPIAAGAKEIYLQEHPGGKIQKLTRHQDFHLVITTNPYRDTPGREALPFEVLGFAQKIWLGSFDRHDYIRILNHFMRDFDIPGYAKADIVDRMIDFHFAIEARIGKTLGEHHTERYYLGIRELGHWSGDIARIYNDMEEKNLEFAFIEGLMVNYNIFTEAEEEKQFKHMVYENLLVPRLNRAAMEIIKSRQRGEAFSLKPIYEFLSAYQVLLEDDLYRRETCDLIKNKLESVMGYIPEFSLGQMYDFTASKVTENEELCRSLNDAAYTTGLAKRYADDGQSAQALQACDTIVNDVRIATQRINHNGGNGAGGNADMDAAIAAMLTADTEASAKGVSPNILHISQLMTAGLIYKKFGSAEGMVKVAAVLMPLLKGENLGEKDVFSYLTAMAPELLELISAMPAKERSELSKALQDLVNDRCFGVAQGSLYKYKAIYSGIVISSQYLYSIARYAPERLEPLAKDLIQRYRTCYSESKENMPAPAQDVVELDPSDFWHSIVSVMPNIPENIRDIIIRELSQEINTLKTDGKPLYDSRERASLILELARGISYQGDKQRTAELLNDAINLAETSGPGKTAINVFKEQMARGRQVGKTVTAATWVNEAGIALNCEKSEEFIKQGSLMSWQRRLYEEAYGIAAALPPEKYREIAERLRDISPPVIVHDIDETKRFTSWSSPHFTFGSFYTNILRTLLSIPDFSELDFVDGVTSGLGPEAKAQLLISIIEKMPLGEKVMNPAMPETLSMYLSVLEKIMSATEKLPVKERHQVISSLFHVLGPMTLRDIDGLGGNLLLRWYTLLRKIKRTYEFDPNMVAEISRLNVGFSSLEKAADTAAEQRRHLEIKKQGDSVMIGYVKLPLGKPLDERRVPDNIPWVNNIYTEESKLLFLANCFKSHRPALLFSQPGSRPEVVIQKAAHELNYELHTIDCYDTLSVIDILGGLSPVLESAPGEKRKLAQERGLLSTHLVEKSRKAEAKTGKIICVHNIDFLSERVRAALHNFLLKGFVYVTDDKGKRVMMVLPDNVHIVATMSSESNKEISDAFYNRHKRTCMPSLTIESRTKNELEQALVTIYGLSSRIAKLVVRIAYGAMVLDGNILWPSGLTYGFSVKDALALGRYYTLAKAEYARKGISVPDLKVLFQEAYRLYASGLSDAIQDNNESDRLSFVRLVLKTCFPKVAHSILTEDIVLDSNGVLREMHNVPVSPVEGAHPLFEIPDRYRLSFVPSLIMSAGSILRAWQPAWGLIESGLKWVERPNVVFITGETGVAKTTLAINLAMALGMNPYVYSTHQGSNASDLLADIAPDGTGGYIARVKDFAKLAEAGNCVLVIDEGNIKSQLVQVVAPISRGEGKIKLVIPGDGRRVSDILRRILGEPGNMDSIEKKLMQFRSELFSSDEKKFGLIMDEFEKLTETAAKEQYLRKFFDFAEGLRKSGPIEIELGKNVFVIVTQNPEAYAGRDPADPVLVHDSRKTWATARNSNEEALAIVDSFLGILPPLLTENVFIRSPDAPAEEPLIADLRMGLPFAKDEGGLGFLDRISMLRHKATVQQKTGIIQLTIAFLTDKRITVVPGNGFAISEDGKKMFIPFKQLVQLPVEMITGIIIHEIRHQRYTPSGMDIENIIDGLLSNGVINAQEAGSIRAMFKDRRLNWLFQLAENARTDSIRHPGYEGENDYLNMVRQDEFLDERIARFPEAERAKEEKALIDWANRFPDQAFITELCNIVYFGKTSGLFGRYSATVQTAVNDVREKFMFATKDAAVHPDFDAPDFDAAKKRCFGIYLTRLAKDVIPVYTRLYESAKPEYEKEKEKAEETAKKYIGYMDPHVEIKETEKGEKVARTRTEARLEGDLKAAAERLLRLKASADKIRERFKEKKNLVEQHHELGNMRTVLNEARESVAGLATKGIPEQYLGRCRLVRDEIQTMFNEMVQSFWTRGCEALKKHDAKSPVKEKVKKLAEERAKKLKALAEGAEAIAGDARPEVPLADFYVAKQHLEHALQQADWSYIGLANCAPSQSDMDRAFTHYQTVQRCLDDIESMIGQKQSVRQGHAAERDMMAARMLEQASDLEQLISGHEQALTSNPLMSQVMDSERELSHELMKIQETINRAYAAGLPAQSIHLAERSREGIKKVLEKAENLSASLANTEGREPMHDEIDEAEAILDNAVKKVGDLKEAALSMTKPGDIANAVEEALKELRKVEAAMFSLSTAGAGQEAMDKGQRVRESVLKDIDDMNSLLGQQAASNISSERMANPVEDERSRIVKYLNQAKAAFDSLKARAEADITAGDIEKAYGIIEEQADKVLTAIHKAAYLGANNDILDEMYRVYIECMRMSNSLVLALRKMLSVKEQETSSGVAEILHGAEEKYSIIQREVSSLKPDTVLAALNHAEHSVLELVNDMKKFAKDAADLGGKEETVKKLLVYRERLMRSLMGIEKVLRDRRMESLRGMKLGQLEQLIDRIRERAASAIKSLKDDASVRDVEEVKQTLSECLDAIVDLLGRMAMSGSHMSVIDKALDVRNDIITFYDRFHDHIRTKMKDMADTVSSSEKLDEVVKVWREAQELKTGMDKKEPEKLLDEISGHVRSIMSLLDELSIAKAPEEAVAKARFSRKDIIGFMDEILLALRDKAAEEARDSGLPSGMQLPMMQGQPANPEEQLDAILNGLLDEMRLVMEDVAKKKSANAVHKGIDKLLGLAGKLNKVIYGLSANGVPENQVLRCMEARSMVWGNVRVLRDSARSFNERPGKRKPAEELDKLSGSFREAMEAINKNAGKVSEISSPAELSAAAQAVISKTHAIFKLFTDWNETAGPSSSDLDIEAGGKAMHKFDSIAALLRDAVRAYKEMQPPQGGMMGGMPGQGGMPGMGGTQGAGGGQMAGGMGAGQAGAGQMGGAMGGAAGAEAGTEAGGAGAGEGGGGGAGKGAPAWVPLGRGERGGDEEKPDAPDLPASTEGKGASQPKKPTVHEPSEKPAADMDEFKKMRDKLVKDRLKEMRQNPSTQSRVRSGSNRARKDADRIIRLFKQRDADIILDDAPTGLIVNVPRFIRGSQEPFDVEYEHLGDVSLSFGLYVDNSGSIGAIKRYVADAAAYLIHLFEGIGSTRTGKDKFDYCIKTFDTGLNSFKGFKEKLSKSELQSLPLDLESILGTGGTSINTALSEILLDFENVKEKTRVAFFLTDGQDSVDPSLVAQIEAKGITLIGVGVGTYSANVANIFTRYLIFSNPKNELPDALVKMATMLALGKKLPEGDLKDALGVRIGSATDVRMSPETLFYQTHFMHGAKPDFGAAQNLPMSLLTSGSPAWSFETLLGFKRRLPRESSGSGAEDMIPLSDGKKQGHLSKGTVKRDLGTLFYLGLVSKTGIGDNARYKVYDFEDEEKADIIKVLESLGDRPGSAEKKKARATLLPVIAKRAMRDLLSGLIERSAAAEKTKEKIIVGIDTSWIPASQRPYVQGVLNSLGSLVEKRGFSNASFIRNDDPERLAAAVSKAVSETGTPLANVVIIGDHKSFRTHGSAFAPLRKPRGGRTGAYCAEVVIPKGMPDSADLGLADILSKSFARAFSGDPKRWHTYLIRIEPYNVEILKSSYRAQKQVVLDA